MTDEQFISKYLYFSKKADFYGILSEPCNALVKSHPQLLHLKYMTATFVCVTSESIYLPTVRLVDFVITNSLCWYFVSSKSLDVLLILNLGCVSLHKVGLTTWAVTEQSILMTCDAFYVFTVLAREGTDSKINFRGFHK